MSRALAQRPASAIVAQAAGDRLPSYVTREQARAIINATTTTVHRLLLECLADCLARWRLSSDPGAAGPRGSAVRREWRGPLCA
jgi:hypothetical protein